MESGNREGIEKEIVEYEMQLCEVEHYKWSMEGRVWEVKYGKLIGIP